MNIMKEFCTFSLCLFLFFPLLLPEGKAREVKGNSAGGHIPILVYHRFGPAAADSMTIPTGLFESHLKYLAENGYKVIPLRNLVDQYLKGIVGARYLYVQKLIYHTENFFCLGNA